MVGIYNDQTHRNTLCRQGIWLSLWLSEAVWFLLDLRPNDQKLYGLIDSCDTHRPYKPAASRLWRRCQGEAWGRRLRPVACIERTAVAVVLAAAPKTRWSTFWSGLGLEHTNIWAHLPISPGLVLPGEKPLWSPPSAARLGEQGHEDAGTKLRFTHWCLYQLT